jgi:rubredoxin
MVTATTPRAMTCDFCGREFTEDRGQSPCQVCPLGAGCGKMRCPHCGYENMQAPDWVERLRGWLSRPAGAK